MGRDLLSRVDLLATVWDALREALLLGWAATAVFCGLTGVAVAGWAGIRWWWGLLAGAVALWAGLAVLLAVGAARAGARRQRAWAPSSSPVPPAESVPVTTPAPWPPRRPSGPPGLSGPSPGLPPPAPDPGFRASVRRGWRWWTRTPPTRGEWVVAGLALALAVGFVVVTQLSWLRFAVVGRGVVSVGAFEIQLGLFCVLAALAAAVAGVGVLRRRSAWWPVLLLWFGTWWVFVVVEVRRHEDVLDDLGGLVRDQTRSRFGFDVHPQVELGVGWSVTAGLAAAAIALALVLLVLHARRGGQYRPHVPSAPAAPPPWGATGPPYPAPALPAPPPHPRRP